jgi:hypothetical protein
VNGAFELAADSDSQFGKGPSFGVERADFGGGVAKGVVGGEDGRVIFGELEVAGREFFGAGGGRTFHDARVAQRLREIKRARKVGLRKLWWTMEVIQSGLNSGSRVFMKSWKLSVGVLALVLVGCTSLDEGIGDEMARLTPVEPPTFIIGDIAEQFGNANFTARLEVQKGVPGTRAPIFGDFFGREGSLFFISDEQRGKRGISGGLSAFWDARTKTAYLLNDPLQAYAPMKAMWTNGPAEAVALGEELLNGERCKKSVIYQRALTGTNLVPTLIVWRAVALGDLPIRIQSTNNTQAVTLNITRVKLQAPQADYFILPNGFKAFPTTDAMMAELVQRRKEALDARARSRRAKFGDSRTEDDPLMQQRPVRPY